MALTQVQGGMISGGPAFSAYLSTTQTVTSSTFTKIAINTETFDTNNNYDTTNYRFTPTVAGYYQVNGMLFGNASGGMTAIYASLYKNGALYQYGGAQNLSVGTSNQSMLINTLVYMNGTTDYLEVYGVIVGSGTCSFITTAGSANYFNAAFIRAT